MKQFLSKCPFCEEIQKDAIPITLYNHIKYAHPDDYTDNPLDPKDAANIIHRQNWLYDAEVLENICCKEFLSSVAEGQFECHEEVADGNYWIIHLSNYLQDHFNIEHFTFCPWCGKSIERYKTNARKI